MWSPSATITTNATANMGLTVTNLEGLTRVRKRLEAINRLDFTPLMAEGARILNEDNRRRALAGLDCNDQPMPVTMREINAATSRRKGTGPPLAPNRRASRVIQLAETSYTRSAPWVSMLRWIGFDSKNGLPILGLHAYEVGTNHPYPRRDVISNPTPIAVARFREALEAFVLERIKTR